MPPVYQPEVAAEAIAWAADHDRRELFVGWPTVKAIVGNRIALGWLDHYLAHNGVDCQMIDEPENPDWPDNLWHPLRGDRGEHGRFGHLASASSWQLRVDMHRGWLAAAGGCIAGLALASIMARSRQSHSRERSLRRSIRNGS
ncbi:MAG: hypothetical protein ACYC61_12220 [Isosphaeraceae bacterium]